MNFVPVALAALGLKEFKKDNDGKVSFSDVEKETLKNMGFTDACILGIEAEANMPDDGKEPEPSKAQAIQGAVVQAAMEQISKLQQEVATLTEQTVKGEANHCAQIQERDAKIADLQKKVATLASLPDVAPAADMATGADTVRFNLDDDKQLGGMQGEMYSLDRPYNKRARAAMLAAKGYDVKVAAASPQDFSRLNEDLGAFYRTQWTDRIQSFLVKLPSIFEIFPMQSGYQDLATLVNVFFTEMSQADNTVDSDFNKVQKGSYEFGTETLRMYGVMFAHTFRNLKELEQTWIGYLNREGSNPIKLSFVEFILVEIAKILHNEQQLRLVNGVRVEPDPNVPGKYLEAADGIYEYLRKRIDGYTDFTPNGGKTGKTVYQIKPFDLPAITEGNIGEVFYQGTRQIPAKYRDTGTVVLYVPTWMLPLYHKYNEAHYGQNKDYEKNIYYVKEYPSVKIVPIANADNHHRIFWTIDGNVQTYCQVEGEMYMFSMEQRNWTLEVWSNWKESIQAQAVGYKYLDKAEMDGSRQLIWANNEDLPETYFVEMKPDTNPSALLHSSMETVKNNGLFTITDITDAPIGKVLTLKCGVGGTDGVTIKKSGNFELITADWTPAKGEQIKLMKRADGKFIEISRGQSAVEDTYEFAPDATAPSVAGATTFITGINTKETALTTLENAVVGQVYTIYGNGSDNATTIANSGNFVLTAEMTLSEGKFIKLVKASNGKFYEMARG